MLYWPWLLAPENGPCLGNGCWGGIDYARRMVQRNAASFEQISKIISGLLNTSSKLLDAVSAYTGKKMPGFIGFGADAIVQWNNDASNPNLTLLERGLRAGILGIEGSVVSGASTHMGIMTGLQFFGELLALR